MLARLRREHEVMRRLAGVLAEEATLIGNGDGGDLVLMRDVLRYLTEHPDRCHHPLEDLALWALADRGLLARASAEALDFQHRALRYHGAHLLQLLECAFADVPQSRPAIANAAEHYAVSLRGHVDHEEQVLFPRLEAHFEPHDWNRIAQASTDLVGPEHAAQIEEQLRRLLASIAERTACSCSATSDAGRSALSSVRRAEAAT
jgi:hemerythrin-like domain-containing protein